MKYTRLKSLFSAAFLGFMLVGCSTTPTSETTDESAVQGTENGSVVETSAAVESALTPAQELAEMQAQVAGLVVRFDFDRSEVKSEFYEVIQANARYMQADSSANVTISGHCDERGTREYNLALGERRAIAVKNALIAEGVAADRITVVSFGEDNPVDEAHNEQAWSKNRRAEFAY